MAEPFRFDAGWHFDDPIVRYDSFVPEPPTTPLTKVKRMGLTTTELFGFADAVTQAMTSNTAELATKGLTVGPWLTEGETLRSTAVAKNDAQEAKKAALKTATMEWDAAAKPCYDFFSSKLDAMIGAYGKTTPMGKQLARIRSDIRRGNGGTPPPPTP